MTATKRVRVEVALNTIEKTIIDNDVEVHGISRAEAIRRRAFDNAAEKVDPNLEAYRAAVAAVSLVAGGQLPPTQIEAIAASVLNTLYKNQ